MLEHKEGGKGEMGLGVISGMLFWCLSAPSPPYAAPPALLFVPSVPAGGLHEPRELLLQRFSASARK